MPAHTGEVHDDVVAVGLGLGPCNLGLACLSAPVEEFDGVFQEARDQITGREVYPIEKSIACQEFGAPEDVIS
ncbi:SidA/IucD/PvdA family monooxygenase [Streptomyces sp. SBT349]|uniref:SidA/IucD/PvdA family monooxygenase n=1 Tax=Streptomyces sp. SBT349 TaxID=1580539 RepID=UPI00066E5B9A|nr:SidA/IucD/PvdA family monooxygenase [Streptomyces sp. SBT349]